MKHYYLNCRFTFRDGYVESIRKIKQIIFDPVNFCFNVYYLYSGEASARFCDLSSVDFYITEYIPTSSFKRKEAFYIDEIEPLINFYNNVFNYFLEDLK